MKLLTGSSPRLKPLLLDTAFFYSLLARNCTYHAKAVQHLHKAITQGRSLLVTDHIIAETATLLKARSLGHLCSAFFEHLESHRLAVIWIDPSRFEKARAFLLRHSDHGYSFTDCASFVVMKEFHIREALTTDRHFVQAGFKALLLDE